MDFENKHILVLDGYARQCLPFIRAFKQLGCTVSVLCDSKIDCGYLSRLPDNKILGACSVKRLEETRESIISTIKTDKYDLVLPLTEYSATILSQEKEKLSQYAYIAVNDWELFDFSQDKLNVMKICEELNLPCPKTVFDIKKATEIKNLNLQFPIILKPRNGYGAKGFHKFENETELVEYIKINNVDLVDMVIQECLPQNGLVLSDNMFIDQNGEVKSSYLYGSYRVFPVGGGSGTLNITFENQQVHKDCKTLIEKLGLKGIIGVDLMIDPRDNIAKILEINLRPLACAKIGFLAGINQAEQLLDDAFGAGAKYNLSYRTDVRVRMSQIDVLWFIKSPDRFKCKPSWFDNRHTTDQMFSFDDPLPWFAFLFNGIRNLKKELELRK